jgi:uncharacterized protein (TIRG00374 family)
MNNTIKKIIGYSIGIIILIVLIIKIDLELAKSIIANLKFIYLVPLLILSILTIFISGINIKILLKAKKSIKTRKIFKYQLIEYISSIFLPFSASSLSIIYLLKKHEDIGIGISTSTIVLDKAITFFLTAIIAFFAFTRYFGFGSAINIIYALIIAMIIIYLLFYSKTTRKIIIRFIPEKIRNKLTGVTTHFREMVKDQKELLVMNISITLIKFLVKSLKAVFAFLMLGFSLKVIDALFITTLAQLAVVFPITPAGIGVRQAIGISLFSQIGIPLTAGVAMYLLLMIIDYTLAAIFSFFISHQKFD